MFLSSKVEVYKMFLTVSTIAVIGQYWSGWPFFVQNKSGNQRRDTRSHSNVTYEMMDKANWSVSHQESIENIVWEIMQGRSAPDAGRKSPGVSIFVVPTSLPWKSRCRKRKQSYLNKCKHYYTGGKNFVHKKVWRTIKSIIRNGFVFHVSGTLVYYSCGEKWKSRV